MTEEGCTLRSEDFKQGLLHLVSCMFEAAIQSQTSSPAKRKLAWTEFEKDQDVETQKQPENAILAYFKQINLFESIKRLTECEPEMRHEIKVQLKLMKVKLGKLKSKDAGEKEEGETKLIATI